MRTLYAGMSCRAEIATEIGAKGIKLPIEAVHEENNKFYVWLLNKDNSVTKQWVEIGLSSDIEQAIESGLAENDKVILGPARAVSKFKEGDSVSVKVDEEGQNNVSDNT